jgi:hypothetical protein
VRWGPQYGRRVNRRLEMGRPLGRRTRNRLFTRPKAGKPNGLRLPAYDWRLRLRQHRRRQKRVRLRGYSLSWMNHSITRVRTDARANLVTGVISHVRWSYDYVLKRRKVLAYRRSRKHGRRLEMRMRRWCHRQQAEEQRSGEAPEGFLPAALGGGSPAGSLSRSQRRLNRWRGLQGYRSRWRLMPRRLSRRRRHSQRPQPAPAGPHFWHPRKTPEQPGPLKMRDLYFLTATELPAGYRP